jgi:hypothetical protein
VSYHTFLRLLTLRLHVSCVQCPAASEVPRSTRPSMPPTHASAAAENVERVENWCTT